MIIRRIVLLSLLAAAALAQGAKKEVGSLVIDGIPDVPSETLERLNQYQNTRGATFAGWDAAGKGILILTRFGETAQVHHVAGPGADRQQLTFTREPIGDLEVDRSRPSGFFYGQDVGGGEFAADQRGQDQEPAVRGAGAKRPRVPINESEQIVATVRKNGGKVWYLIAKDEGHGFKKKTNVDYFNAATRLFFETYLLK